VLSTKETKVNCEKERPNNCIDPLFTLYDRGVLLSYFILINFES
jgi:hypothetical protein